MNLNKDTCKQIPLCEETAICIEDKLKDLIHSYISVFNDKHLDQIIVCTIYIIQAFKKEVNKDQMFNHIIQSYHKAKPNDSENLYKSIFSKVKHSTKNYDIIAFYNNVFVPLFNEDIQQTLTEEKTPKKRKLSSPEHCLIQKKLKFDEDSAFHLSRTVYDSLKKNSSTGLSTPVKNFGGYSGIATPDLSKTPRTEKVRSFVEDYLLNNEQFSLTLSPKKQNTSVDVPVNSFKARILVLEKSNLLPVLCLLFNFSNTKIDVIEEEAENVLLPTTPTFTKIMTSGNFQFSQGSQGAQGAQNPQGSQGGGQGSQSSQPATPEFKKNYEI